MPKIGLNTILRYQKAIICQGNLNFLPLGHFKISPHYLQVIYWETSTVTDGNCCNQLFYINFSMLSYDLKRLDWEILGFRNKVQKSVELLSSHILRSDSENLARIWQESGKNLAEIRQKSSKKYVLFKLCIWANSVRKCDSSVGKVHDKESAWLHALGFEPSQLPFYVCFFNKIWNILSYIV